MPVDYYDSGKVYFGRPDEAYVGLSPEEQDTLQRRLVAAQVQPEPVAPQVPAGLMYSPLQDANINAYTVQQAQEEEQRRLMQATERDRILAEEQAIKLRGRMNYQRDVEAGIPPSEALRRNISDLLFSNPAQMAHVLDATEPPSSTGMPGEINSVPIKDPSTGKVIGHSVWDSKRNAPQSTNWQSPDKPSYQDQQQGRIAMRIWQNARQDLNALKRMGEIDKKLIPDFQSKLAEATAAEAAAAQAAKGGGKAPDMGGTKTAQPLTSDLAKQFLQRAGGDKEKARQLARDAGYQF